LNARGGTPTPSVNGIWRRRTNATPRRGRAAGRSAGGFERFYGFLGGETNQWFPDLVYDNPTVDPPATPEQGCHLSADLADEAIRAGILARQKTIGLLPDDVELSPINPHGEPDTTGAAWPALAGGGFRMCPPPTMRSAGSSTISRSPSNSTTPSSWWCPTTVRAVRADRTTRSTRTSLQQRCITCTTGWANGFRRSAHPIRSRWAPMC